MIVSEIDRSMDALQPLYLFFVNFIISVTLFLFGFILSGVTLFVYLNREKILSIPGDKMEICLVVVYLGVTGVVALGVTV